MLARYLLPRVTQREKQVNPAAKGTESWAWVPPPLVGEGESAIGMAARLPVESLSDSTGGRAPDAAFQHVVAGSRAIWPSTLRAKDGVQYPYAVTEHRQPSYLADKEAAYQQKLKDAPPDAAAGDAKRDRSKTRCAW